MTTEQLLTSLSGWAISALFKYLPALRSRFDRLNGLGKRLIIIAFSLIVSLAVFGLKCGNIFQVPILEPCTRAGWLDLANIALTVAINTQAAYLLLPNGQIDTRVDPCPDPLPHFYDNIRQGKP